MTARSWQPLKRRSSCAPSRRPQPPPRRPSEAPPAAVHRAAPATPAPARELASRHRARGGRRTTLQDPDLVAGLEPRAFGQLDQTVALALAEIIDDLISDARRTTLRDGSARFYRSSLQRGWITSEEGRVLEDVFVSDAKQTIYFLGRPQMVEESGNALVASPFQPLFHVRHGVGGSEQAPLNLWSIVLLTDAPDPRYCEPFEQMVRTGLL